MSEKSQRSESNAANRDENRDPLSGERGAHPVGTGVGAAAGGLAAGAATGAAVGTVAGPIGTAVGTAVGAAIGAVTGGLAGKAVAEHIDPTVEHDYWRSNYSKRSYVGHGRRLRSIRSRIPVWMGIPGSAIKARSLTKSNRTWSVTGTECAETPTSAGLMPRARCVTLGNA